MHECDLSRSQTMVISLRGFADPFLLLFPPEGVPGPSPPLPTGRFPFDGLPAGGRPGDLHDIEVNWFSDMQICGNELF